MLVHAQRLSKRGPCLSHAYDRYRYSILMEYDGIDNSTIIPLSRDRPFIFQDHQRGQRPRSRSDLRCGSEKRGVWRRERSIGRSVKVCGLPKPGKCPSPSERPEVEPSDFASSPWRHDDDRRKRDRSGWCWMFIEASRQSKMEKSELYIMLQTVDKPITRRTVHALDRYACGGFTKYWPQPPSP